MTERAWKTAVFGLANYEILNSSSAKVFSHAKIFGVSLNAHRTKVGSSSHSGNSRKSACLVVLAGMGVRLVTPEKIFQLLVVTSCTWKIDLRFLPTHENPRGTWDVWDFLWTSTARRQLRMRHARLHWRPTNEGIALKPRRKIGYKVVGQVE